MKRELLTIKPNEREEYPDLKSKSELKKLKLMPHPLAKPRALVIRKMYGNYYVYDKNKTVPYKEPSRDTLMRKTRRERLSCKLCGEYLGRYYKAVVNQYGYCPECEHKEQKLRCKQIHDRIRLINKEDILVLDVETTGLNSHKDELLQIAFIDGNGKELFNRYLKPKHVTEWGDAYAVNNISPDKVAMEKHVEEYLHELQELIDKAELIVGYNVEFDIEFLKAAGLNIPDEKKRFDVMKDFAVEYGEWNREKSSCKNKKLTFAAEYYQYDDFQAHDALNDTLATLYIFNKLIQG